MARYEEIKKLLLLNRKVREIARALGVSRKTVRAVRDQELPSPAIPRKIPDPLWMKFVEWPHVVSEVGQGHPLKFIWEEKAKTLTTYSNFHKQFYKRFPSLKEAVVTLRQFEPGERAEVDYAGDKIEWVDLKTGEIFAAVIFVGILGFSQRIFAIATEDMKSRNWLTSHKKMFEDFGGVPSVTVPDCLRQGVIKGHLYDPDINPAYGELASHYGTAIVPARPRKPKDKGLVEGAVRIVMRLFRFRYRRHTFTSLAEINRALRACVGEINKKPHTKFKTSRMDRFEELEKAALKNLPKIPYEISEWKKAKLHADCYVSVDCNYYSVPHIHRGKELRVKLSDTRVEIYLDFERIACHERYRGHVGKRVSELSHFPESSKAYYEVTPQNLLSQSRFIHADLHALIVELFNEDVYGNIRRVQGLIRVARKEINKFGHEEAIIGITAAIKLMRQFNQFRVRYFEENIKREYRKKHREEDREIERNPNPLLRYGEVNNMKEIQ